MRELERIAEEVMTPRKVVRRKRREGSKEEKSVKGSLLLHLLDKLGHSKSIK